jgi:hypothetical protein
MTKKQIFKKVREGIEKGTYKSIALHNEEGEQVVQFSHPSKNKALDRLDYIIDKVENSLKPGKYILTARTAIGNTGLKDEFTIEIKTPVTLPISSGVEDKTNEQETTMRNIDWEDYKELLDEISQLKAKNAELEIALKYQALLSEHKQQQTLNDVSPVPKSGLETILSGLADAAPTISALADNYFSLQNRKLDLEEKKLSSGGYNTTRKKKIRPSKEKVLMEMELLYENDEDSFNATLDEMEQRDPELYRYICEQMGLEEGEEETE